MVTEIISGAVSLVFGFATGWYFHRKATKVTLETANAAREQNEKLRRDLRAIARGYRTPGALSAASPADVSDLRTAVRARALATQDASGQVSRRDLIAYFVQRGPAAAEVEAALVDLASAGILREDGQWLRVP